ncbi:MAG: hypothetical protein GX352_00960 [Clostridiales bacterium]|nr:hypothetical protein [Clostridiales bacterium]
MADNRKSAWAIKSIGVVLVASFLIISIVGCAGKKVKKAKAVVDQIIASEQEYMQSVTDFYIEMDTGDDSDAYNTIRDDQNRIKGDVNSLEDKLESLKAKMDERQKEEVTNYYNEQKEKYLACPIKNFR